MKKFKWDKRAELSSILKCKKCGFSFPFEMEKIVIECPRCHSKESKW